MRFNAIRSLQTRLAAGQAALTVRPVLAIAAVLAASAAQAGVDIGSPTTGGFAKFGAWMQAFVDFIDGPYGLAAVVISIVVAFSIWMFVPREGIMAPIVRIAVSAIAIFNVAALVAAFQ